MTISLPIKAFLGGLAIIVSLASAAQAGRPLIHKESVCKAAAKFYGKKWGGSGNYETKGCYFYENGKYGGKAYYGKGGVLWTQNANTGDGDSKNGKRRFDQLCHISPAAYTAWRKTYDPAPWPRASRANSEGGLLFYVECDCGNKEGNMFGFDNCKRR